MVSEGIEVGGLRTCYPAKGFLLLILLFAVKGTRTWEENIEKTTLWKVYTRYRTVIEISTSGDFFTNTKEKIRIFEFVGHLRIEELLASTEDLESYQFVPRFEGSLKILESKIFSL